MYEGLARAPRRGAVQTVGDYAQRRAIVNENPPQKFAAAFGSRHAVCQNGA
jgi:hypothetical protein